MLVASVPMLLSEKPAVWFIHIFTVMLATRGSFKSGTSVVEAFLQINAKMGWSNVKAPSSTKHMMATEVMVFDTLPQYMRQSGVMGANSSSVMERTPNPLLYNTPLVADTNAKLQPPGNFHLVR